MDDRKETGREAMESMGRLEDLLRELNTMNQMMDDFLAAEGMIICENCLDNVFDDDEDIVSLTDDDGRIRHFCCQKCLEEWKLKK